MVENSILLAKEVRKRSLQMVHQANSSHIGGALSMTDILAVLYTSVLKYDSENPDWDERDRFILSKGHACVSLYSILALRGFFPVEELNEYGKNGSRLLTHITHYVPGVEISAGSSHSDF
jgi:transketolase